MTRKTLLASITAVGVSAFALQAQAMGDGMDGYVSWPDSSRHQLAQVKAGTDHAVVQTSGLTGRTSTAYQVFNHSQSAAVPVCDGVGSDCTGGTTTWKIQTSGLTGRSGVTYTPYTQYRPRGLQGDRPIDTPASAGLPDGTR